MSLKNPYLSSLRTYQKEATQKWVDNNRIGFFEMATGSGKTVTALNCALDLFKENREVRLLILVPTLTLANQWEGIVNKFGFEHIIQTNGKNKNWDKDIIHLCNLGFNRKITYCIISTYATFLTKRFQSAIDYFPKSTFLVADEAHNFGTERIIKKYPKQFTYRLGLSATPYRYFDEAGTRNMLNYFGSTNGVTFQYDMQTAIQDGYLCEYYYNPKTVELTDSEMEQYYAISKKLWKFFDSDTGGYIDSPSVSILLQKRKQVIQKAHNKTKCLREILHQLLLDRPKLNYTLIYVPEGKSNTFDDEDQRLINEYSKVVRQEFGLNQHQFIGETDNRKDVLERFEKGEIEVLTAMKCLDEGIDIARTEIAIFCASSNNSRQFIQRRGRILRKHPEKQFAYIYDMIVIPKIKLDKHSENWAMERNMLNSELRRVREFAELAVNKYQSLETLDKIAKEYELNIYSNND